MIYCGADPGLSGALAFYDSHDGSLQVHDMPTVSVKRNGKARKDIDYLKLGELLYVEPYFKKKAFVERVGSMPGQGSSSGWTFGKATGAVLGALGAHGWEIIEVPPQTWKKYWGLTGKDKDASRLLAIEQFTNYTHYFKLKKHNGRSDASLIALWGLLAENER